MTDIQEPGYSMPQREDGIDKLGYAPMTTNGGKG